MSAALEQVGRMITRCDVCKGEFPREELYYVGYRFYCDDCDNERECKPRSFWQNLSKIDGFSQEKGEPDYWLDAVRNFWAETGLGTDSVKLAVIVKWFDKRRALNILNRNLVQLRTIGQALLGVTLPDMPNTPCQRLLRVATEKVWHTMESDWPDNEEDAAKALDKLRGAYDELTDCANSMSREHLIVAADVLRWGDELGLVIRNIVGEVDDDRD